jgi:plastocyanin
VRDEKLVRRRRVAVGLVFVGVMVGGVSVAAALPRADVQVNALTTNHWDKESVQVQTGETVTWNLDSGNGIPHNVEGLEGPDGNWAGKTLAPPRSAPPVSFTFTQPGTYTYLCRVHPDIMLGSVTVAGSPVTPTPTPSETATPPPTGTPIPTASPRPTASPAPSASGPVTPAPAGSSRGDVTAPVVSRLKLKAVAHGAKVSFLLSEPATVTIRFKRGTRTVRAAQLAARPGARAFTVRGSRIARARYEVEVEARDARGNKAVVQRAKVRVTR